MKQGSMEFLDKAIVAISTACGGSQSEEERDAWAARVLDDAIALAAARERKLLKCEALDDEGRPRTDGFVPPTPAAPEKPEPSLDSGASVVVDREEWERTKADLERLRAFYRSVNDEIPEGLWPAATTLDAFRKLVDGYANVCADAKALHEREEERDRALADTEHRHALAERERDALAAKLAEAEGKNADWSASFDLYHAAEMRGIRMWQDAGPNRELAWPDKGKLTVWLLDQLDEAQAEAERLRGERDGLRALGVREAEKNATPFVVDREAMREAISNVYDEGSGDDGDATDAAIIEYERQRAEHEKGGAA